MKKNKKINNFGFSLIEIILSLFLFVILSLNIITLFQAYQKYSVIIPKSITNANAKNENLKIIDNLKTYIREAQNILDSTVINSITYNSGTSTLVLQLRSIDNNDNIILGSNDVVVFNLETSTFPYKLYRIINADSNSKRSSGKILISDSVKNLIFKYSNLSPKYSKSVIIYLETIKKYKNEDLIEQSTTTVNLR